MNSITERAEALVRWRRPDGIVVRPEHFLPFYEKNGKIVELDFYVFEQVAAFLEKTKRSGITPVPVSVNVSALHAEDPQTTRRYLEILEKYKVDPGMLEMELKETDTEDSADAGRGRFHEQDSRTAGAGGSDGEVSLSGNLPETRCERKSCGGE